MITFDDFAKIELKVGTITQAEKLAGSNKLLKLQVDIGEEQPRQILAGLAQTHQPDDLINIQIIIVANLQPKKIMGTESQGMLLAADQDGKPILLHPESPVPPGTKIL